MGFLHILLPALRKHGFLVNYLFKTDTIVGCWIETVRQDRQIESADDLSHTAIQDHLPDVLRAIATVLSHPG